VARAEEHVKALRGFDTRDRVRVQGTDRVDEKKLSAAIDKVDGALRACVKGAPLLLLSVEVVVHGPEYVPPGAEKKPKQAKKPKKPKQPKSGGMIRTLGRDDRLRGPVLPAAGAQVVVVDSDEPPEAVDAAVACVAKAAGGAKLPAPATPGTFVRYTIPVITR
jgi:hypothetical protein